MEDTTTTTTDTSTAASTTTATAADTTAPTQTETTEQPRPRTFAEAIEPFKAADDSASSTGEAATTAQQTTEKVVGDKTLARPVGPVPFDTHHKALENARVKAVEEAKPQIEAEVRQRYAWADVVEEPDREELTALYRGLKTDLIGTLTTLIDNASQHPEHAKTLRSQAARLLNAARRVQGESAMDDDEPQPGILLEDGRAVFTADELDKRDAIRDRRLLAQVRSELQPFQQDREKAQQAQAQHELYQRAGDVLKEWSGKPHFTEHKADILAQMEAHPSWSLGDAYAEVLTTKVLPTSEQRGRAAVLADIHHKANAGTLHPQQTTTVTPRKPNGRFTPDLVAAHFAGQA